MATHKGGNKTETGGKMTQTGGHDAFDGTSHPKAYTTKFSQGPTDNNANARLTFNTTTSHEAIIATTDHEAASAHCTSKPANAIGNNNNGQNGENSMQGAGSLRTFKRAPAPPHLRRLSELIDPHDLSIDSHVRSPSGNLLGPAQFMAHPDRPRSIRERQEKIRDRVRAASRAGADDPGSMGHVQLGNSGCFRTPTPIPGMMSDTMSPRFFSERGYMMEPEEYELGEPQREESAHEEPEHNNNTVAVARPDKKPKFRFCGCFGSA